jgi:branched-chain amino acid transport system ATP-binding protein
MAVSSVALELHRGKLHAVVGPNGAGKTTLLNLLSGDRASAGTIHYKGEDITHYSADRRSRIGIGRSYQKTNIFPAFTAFENCRLAAQSRMPRVLHVFADAAAFPPAREAAMHALDAAGLERRGDQVASALSHGEQRQLGRKKRHVEVLLLDEPVRGALRKPGHGDAAGRAPGNAILLVDTWMRVRRCRWITVMVNGRSGKRPASAIHASPPRSCAWRRRPLAAANDDAQRRDAHWRWLLEARELHVYYGASPILHGIDFRIDRGQTVSLMGRNGMGKSTLIRSMLGLVKPRHGEVWVCGTQMTGAEPYVIARQGIAYVPEGRGIFPNLTVRENLIMAARSGPDGRRDWTFDRVLATFPRLSERLENGGWRLSGGEQQMLTIGRALMTNPDLLILDEATEGLAPLIAKRSGASSARSVRTALPR